MPRYSTENSLVIFIRGGEPWLMGYCWSFYFHVTPLLSRCRIFSTSGPAITAYARHYRRHFEDDQQYPPVSSTGWTPLPQGYSGCRTTHAKNLCPLGCSSACFSTPRAKLAKGKRGNHHFSHNSTLRKKTTGHRLRVFPSICAGWAWQNATEQL